MYFPAQLHLRSDEPKQIVLSQVIHGGAKGFAFKCHSNGHDLVPPKIKDSRPAEVGCGDFGWPLPARPLSGVKGERSENKKISQALRNLGYFFVALDAGSLSCHRPGSAGTPYCALRQGFDLLCITNELSWITFRRSPCNTTSGAAGEAPPPRLQPRRGPAAAVTIFQSSSIFHWKSF